MSFNLHSSNENVWQELVKGHQTSHNEYKVALEKFLHPNINRVELIKRAVHKGRDTPTVITAIGILTKDELMAIFPELVYLASWLQGGAMAVRQAILSLPRAWVISNIEAIAEPILVGDKVFDEYRRLLELYSLLDAALTQRLAKKALLHSNLEIQEAGEDFYLS